MTVLPIHADQSRALAAPAAAGYPSAGPEPSDALNARFLAIVLRRRWLLLGASVIGITGLATAYAATRPPVFEATAKIMIGVPQRADIDLGGLVAGLPVDRERIENEMELLRSREVAREVVTTLALDQRPEFNPALLSPEERPLLERVADLIPDPGDLMEQWGLMEPLDDAAGSGAGRDPLSDVIDLFADSLQVWPQGRSHVINLTVETADPRLAAAAANAVAEVYLADRLQAKLDTMRRATGWLDNRLEALRVEAERKEAAVEDYRSQAGLVATEGGGLAAERLGELNRELAAATAAEAQAQAAFSKVQETIATEGASAVPEVLESRTIQELRAAEAVAAARHDELAGELGPRHPQMLEIQKHLASVRGQIQAETSRILSGIQNAYEVARTRSAHVRSEIDRLEGSISNRNDAEGQLRVLEREAEAAQEVYRTFLVQANATGHKESLERPEGRLISRAEVPASPAGPNRQLLVMIGFVGACFTGFGLSLGLELLDRRFRTADQLRARLRLPVLGVVPMLSSLARTRKAPQEHIVDAPDTAFGEAIRSLRTNMTLSGEGRAPRAVLLTSSVQGEGKTSLCLSIGRHAAMSGRRAIVIDCDLRLPRVHEGLGVPNEEGVIEFLEGGSLTDVLRIDEATGLHYVTAGAWHRNAPELLRSARLRDLISLLRARYDLVLIDTPPLLPVSDASVIAGHADLALLVVGWPNARPDTVEVAAARLRQAAGRARIGAIFNNVDVRKVAGYGFTEVEAYRGRYGHYYVAA
jgi:succinoglycan biosynthesis transport protein ExoP